MFVFFSAGIMGYPAENSAQKVEFLQLSYKANKHTFAFCAFRFEFTRGLSESLYRRRVVYFFQGRQGKWPFLYSMAVVPV